MQYAILQSSGRAVQVERIGRALLVLGPRCQGGRHVHGPFKIDGRFRLMPKGWKPCN
jgi:hypothetical protein